MNHLYVSGGSSETGPETSIVFAPSLAAAFAIAYPIFPLEKFDTYRTGSILSRVGPAVITTFLPAKR